MEGRRGVCRMEGYAVWRGVEGYAICRVLATYLSALRSRNAAIQSATLSSDSATLRFFQNLFTQDLNTFSSERYAQKPPRKWPQNAPFST